MGFQPAVGSTQPPELEPALATSCPRSPSSLLSRQLTTPATPAQRVPSTEGHLLSEATAAHPAFAHPIVVNAFNVAASAHAGQLRKSGHPVLVHLIETAKLLAELGLEPDVIAAGLLHDVLDDTAMTESQLRLLVSDAITDMVVRVGQMSDISQLQRENFHKLKGHTRLTSLFLALADVRVVLIKLCDRLHNLRTLDALPPRKQERMAQETLAVFAPLANRLGIFCLKAELEDLCFKALHPREYRALHEGLRQDQAAGQVRACLDTLQSELRGAGVGVKDLEGRPKNLYGVWKKADRKGSLASVYDARAVRVIVGSKEDCYDVLRLVHRIWPPVEGRFKDYVRSPKPDTGYQSLHTVVTAPDGAPMEIQIRTDKMHCVAEFGVAAHWRYKEAGSGAAGVSPQVEAMVAWARHVLTWQTGVIDRKCRPSGSPEADGALGAVARASLEGAPPGDGGELPSTQLGAAGGSGTSFEAYFARSVVPPRPVEAPCLVVHVASTRVEMRELPPGTTAREVLAAGHLTGGAAASPGSRVLINDAEAEDGQVVRLGDRVEILTRGRPFSWSDPQADAAPAGADLRLQRESLNKMYHARHARREGGACATVA